MLKEVLGNGKAVFVCPQCHGEFTGEYNPDFAEYYGASACINCRRSNILLAEEQEKKAKQMELLNTLEERMESSGFEGVFCCLETPVTRHNAEFIWKNKDKNLLISGETGAGKTSSAAFVIRHMMKERKLKVMYRNWSEFHGEYVKAKTSENKSAEDIFFKRLLNLDYLILDELAWRRGNSKLSPAAQELLFDIIDKAYNQKRKCKVWLLGNFYGKALEKMLDDPAPVLRRLQFAFQPVWFDFAAAPKEIVIYSGKGKNNED